MQNAPRFYLCGTARPAVAASARFSQDGSPKQRFVKDAIGLGTYVHPTMGWEMIVTPEVIAHWVEQFAKMKSNGVRVPFVEDHFVSVPTTLGYVDDVYVDGNQLMFVSTVEGEKQIDAVTRVKQVSISVEKKLTDGKGIEYENAIAHIALTPVPVVPGQDDPIPIAASRGQTGTGVPVLQLSATGSLAMKPETLKGIKEKFKIAKELTEDTLVSELSAHLDGIIAERSKASDELKASRLEASTLKSKLDEVEKGKAKPLSDDDAEDRADDVSDRVDRLVKAGGLQPALACSLKAALVGPAKARDSYMLSRVPVAGEDGKRPIRAHAILDVVEQIKPVALGEKTGPQTANMSREVPGQDNVPPAYDPAVTAEMVAMINGK